MECQAFFGKKRRPDSPKLTLLMILTLFMIWSMQKKTHVRSLFFDLSTFTADRARPLIKKLAPAIIVHPQERHLADKKKDRIYFFHHYLSCFGSDRQRISR
jgi:hypothetical protein